MKDIQKIKPERDKLDLLVEEALNNGTPICKAPNIMMQCQKVHDMLLKMEESDTEA
ncbi:MAG: hypothetical protein WDA65_03235 [Christensenellales bacterium]